MSINIIYFNLFNTQNTVAPNHTQNLVEQGKIKKLLTATTYNYTYTYITIYFNM